MIGMVVKRLVQGTLACLCAGEVILSAQELEPDEVKVREKQLKSRKVPESYTAAWRLGGHYRSKGDLKTAEKLLKEDSSPRDFERLPQAAVWEETFWSQTPLTYQKQEYNTMGNPNPETVTDYYGPVRPDRETLQPVSFRVPQ